MKQAVADMEVRGLKHFKRLLPLLRGLEKVGCERDTAGNRQLFMSDYCASVMLYLFNPMINSVRMLQQARALPQVARVLGVKRFSLGSFSESVRVFDPRQLQRIVEELAGELVSLGRDPRLSDLKHALTLVDSTVLQGLTRLATLGCSQTRYNTARDGRAVHGWRLHTQFDLETFCPRKIQISGARNIGDYREHNVLRRSLEADRCYVGDGGYADATLFNDIVARDSSYVIRVREDSRLEVVEERLLSQEALDANVVRDAIVRLGGSGVPATNHATRLITVQVQPHPRRSRKAAEGTVTGTRWTDVIVIVTNRVDLPAELVALIYLYRYSVELFFRLFKQLLGMRHLLSQRREGVEIQVYCCVIACMLINLQTGKKPNKLMVSMMGWYFMGLASEQDVIDFLNKPDNTGVKKRAKDELWKKLGVN